MFPFGSQKDFWLAAAHIDPKSFSTFAFTAASILMSGGQGRLKPSPEFSSSR
jgi:hypothetical protein